MADHLASIFGTEKDRVNCPFYIKIGARPPRLKRHTKLSPPLTRSRLTSLVAFRVHATETGSLLSRMRIIVPSQNAAAAA